MPSLKTRLLFGVVVVASSSTSQAWAQSATLSPTAPRDVQVQDPQVQEAQVEDIVVTAQRREEKSQKVPIAIAVISASRLATAGVSGTQDLANAVPSLSFSSTGFTAQPFLRGVGTSNVAAGDENSVAIYVDGVYHSAPVGSIFALNNIQRIEVDKGPQGTLFGRNATGGVIQIITKDPESKPSFDASIGYATYNTFQGTFYATGGLTKLLATDISAYINNQYDGWGRNVANGAKVNLGKQFSLRNKWLLDLGDTTQVRLTLDYDQNNSDFNTALRAVPPVVPIGALPGSAAANPGFYNNDSDRANGTKVRQFGAALTLDQDLGWAQLTSITAYRDTKASGTLDQDMRPVPIASVSAPYGDKTFSQEFQLKSGDSIPSPFQWVAGLFYFYDLAHSGLEITTAAPLKRTDGNQTTNSYAAFAQATKAIFSDTRLTVGVRYTDDNRRLSESQFSIPANMALLPGYPVNAQRTFSKFTYRVALDHSFAPNILGYISQNRGFKGGVFNMAAPLVAATGQLDVVSPEVLDATELGIKSDWFNRRLRVNVSAFYYNYKQIQLSQYFVNGIYLLNAANAEVKGVDVDLEAVPVKNLNVTAAASFLDGKYTNFPNAPFFTANPTGGVTEAPGNASGFRMIQSPKFTSTVTVRYDIPTSSGKLVLDGSYIYNSGFFWTPDNVLKQSAYSLLNAAATFSFTGGHWDARLWAKNIFDKQYYSYEAAVSPLGDQGAPAAPRTVGIAIRYHH